MPNNPALSEIETPGPKVIQAGGAIANWSVGETPQHPLAL
jgi:hypothetical protein